MLLPACLLACLPACLPACLLPAAPAASAASAVCCCLRASTPLGAKGPRRDARGVNNPPPEKHQACWIFIINLQEGFWMSPKLNNDSGSSQNWSQNAQEEPDVCIFQNAYEEADVFISYKTLPQEASLHETSGGRWSRSVFNYFQFPCSSRMHYMELDDYYKWWGNTWFWFLKASSTEELCSIDINYDRFESWYQILIFFVFWTLQNLSWILIASHEAAAQQSFDWHQLIAVEVDFP